jgi:hypothetical protein
MKRVYLVDDVELVRRRPVDMLSEIEGAEIARQTERPEEAAAGAGVLSHRGLPCCRRTIAGVSVCMCNVGIGQTLLVEGRPGA